MIVSGRLCKLGSIGRVVRESGDCIAHLSAGDLSGIDRLFMFCLSMLYQNPQGPITQSIDQRGINWHCWGGHSKAVRVRNEREFLAWVEAEGITTEILSEPDEDGEKRPSIYLGDSMAGRSVDQNERSVPSSSQDRIRTRTTQGLGGPLSPLL